MHARYIYWEYKICDTRSKDVGVLLKCNTPSKVFESRGVLLAETARLLKFAQRTSLQNPPRGMKFDEEGYQNTCYASKKALSLVCLFSLVDINCLENFQKSLLEHALYFYYFVGKSVSFEF